MCSDCFFKEQTKIHIEIVGFYFTKHTFLVYNSKRNILNFSTNKLIFIQISYMCILYKT